MFELDPFTNDEPIHFDNKEIGKLGDFWKWSYSAVYTPITRGFLAEYLVFKSVSDNADKSFRPPLNYLSTKLEKDEPDIITYFNDEKMNIQVKSIDSLTTDKRFILKKAYKYNPKLDKDNGPRTHNCDVFVLCFLSLDKRRHDLIDNLRKSWNESSFKSQTKTDIQRYKTYQEQLNKSVLNLNNWIFYISPSSTFEKQESVNISKLEKLVAKGTVLKGDYFYLWQHLKHLNTLKAAQHSS